MEKKAAFFDRDGTLIVDYPYLSRLDQIQLLMPAIAIARLCQEHGYTLFVVTNQSGIARGLFDETFVDQTHKYLHNLLMAHGIYIEKYYYCPHHPELGVELYKKKCICRKPATGMFKIAAQEYNISLADSLMFGNSECDLQAGLAAGCRIFSMPQLTTISLDEVAKVLFSGTIMKSVKDKY